MRASPITRMSSVDPNQRVIWGLTCTGVSIATQYLANSSLIEDISQYNFSISGTTGVSMATQYLADRSLSEDISQYNFSISVTTGVSMATQYLADRSLS